MDFLQNGIRTLKRHSISNVGDALWSHIYGDSVSSLSRRTPHSDFPMKNADFASVSSAIVHLFWRKRLQENELTTLQEAVRHLVTTDAGPLIYDYYKENTIKQGMVILRKNIRESTDTDLLTSLGQQWDYFYKEILPTLQAILHPIKAKDLTIRQVTLLAFRNAVVLKLPVKEALHKVTEILPSIRQMLLVLHSVHEGPCTVNTIELEKMVVRVASPYMGVLGLYAGGSEPEIRSNFFECPQTEVPKCPQTLIEVTVMDDLAGSNDDMMALEHRTKRHHMTPLLQISKQHKRCSGMLPDHLLTAVQEQGRGQIRRYSIATS